NATTLTATNSIAQLSSGSSSSSSSLSTRTVVPLNNQNDDIEFGTDELVNINFEEDELDGEDDGLAQILNEATIAVDNDKPYNYELRNASLAVKEKMRLALCTRPKMPLEQQIKITQHMKVLENDAEAFPYPAVNTLKTLLDIEDEINKLIAKDPALHVTRYNGEIGSRSWFIALNQSILEGHPGTFTPGGK
ncbi:MAG: hypothetical protein V4487_06425, partial [Chlamydiota bacterium]